MKIVILFDFLFDTVNVSSCCMYLCLVVFSYFTGLLWVSLLSTRMKLLNN